MSTELCLVNVPRLISPNVIRLRAGRYTIGRSSRQAQLVVPHRAVSRVHAEMEVFPDRQQILVFDRGSRNGLFINDERVNEGCLLVGSWLRLGFPQFWLSNSASGHGDDDGSTLGTEMSPQTPKELLHKMSVLTRAQRGVAVELLLGKSDAVIAEELGIMPNTLRNHIKAIFRALGVNSRAELLASFISAEVLADVIDRLSER